MQSDDVDPFAIFKTVKSRTLKDDVLCKLLPYQIMQVYKLITSIEKNDFTLDGSDTGVGKTYHAIATCAQLDMNPFIICKKRVRNKWYEVCDAFHVNPIAIVNYETIKKCKMYRKDGTRIPCPYISIDEELDTFRWKLPLNTLVIFDEAHVCKSTNTINGALLLSLKFGPKATKKPKVLMLSGSIIDKIENLNIVGYVLGLYGHIAQSKGWIEVIIKKCIQDKKKEKKPLEELMQDYLSKLIYPMRGGAVHISELGELYPKNKIIAECYDLDKNEENILLESYDSLKTSIQLLKDKKNKNVLSQMLRARQNIELVKVPIIKELAETYMEHGYSVCIFVNFTNTLEQLKKILGTTNCVYGEQTAEMNENCINNFQGNAEKIIICNIKSGGDSISLHDIHGGHPRVSLICMSFSVVELLQVLGRIHRAKSKSHALQKIILTNTDIERNICDNINKKIKFLKKTDSNDIFEKEHIVKSDYKCINV